MGPYSTQHSTPTFQVQLFLRLTSPTHIRSSQPRSGASPIQVQYSVRLISITSFSLIQLQHQHSVAFCLCFPTRRQTINKASRQLPLTTPVTTSLHCMTALLLHRSPFSAKTSALPSLMGTPSELSVWPAVLRPSFPLPVLSCFTPFSFVSLLRLRHRHRIEAAALLTLLSYLQPSLPSFEITHVFSLRPSCPDLVCDTDVVSTHLNRHRPRSVSQSSVH